MGFLHRSFRRLTSLSDQSLDPPVFLFCLFFPRPFLAGQFACIPASLFSSSCLICSLPPISIGGCLSLWKGSIGYTRCVSRGHVMRLGTPGRSQSHLTRDGLLRPAEHRLYRAGSADRPTWKSFIGSSNLGDGKACPTPVGSAGVVASLLSCCASSRSAASEARAAARTRWQTPGATLPPTHAGHGSRQNEATMDGARGALVSLGADFRLRGTKARYGCRVLSRGVW
jgi:hypothetical protein